MQKNVLIEFYRFVLILWIVLFHYTARFNTLFPAEANNEIYNFMNGGAVGVALFFMLSGFFMAKSLFRENVYGFRQMLIYCKNRFLRIWYPYILSCLFIVTIYTSFPSSDLLLDGRCADYEDIIKNFFIIHLNDSTQYVDGAHWFLDSLLKIQILFAILLFVKYEKRFLLLSIIFLFSFTNSIILSVYPNFISTFIESTFTSRYLWEVSLGVFIWLWYNKYSWKKMYYLIPIFVILEITREFSNYYFIVFIFIFLLLLKKATIQSRIRIPIQKKFLFLGRISFYWYLIHQNIGYLIILYLRHMNSDENTLIFQSVCLLITMVITFVLSIIIYLVHKVSLHYKDIFHQI